MTLQEKAGLVPEDCSRLRDAGDAPGTRMDLDSSAADALGSQGWCKRNAQDYKMHKEARFELKELVGDAHGRMADCVRYRFQQAQT